MSGFKLIGIRPHENCGLKFLKLLEPGRLYQFYNEYEFYTKDGKFDGVNGEITCYEFDKSIPDDLYRVGNLNVNISAIVGKNGTGKSTLIELLLYTVYYLGANLKDENEEKILYPYEDHILHMIAATNDKINHHKKKKKAVDDYVKKCFLDPLPKRSNVAKSRLKNFENKQNELFEVNFLIGDLKKRVLKLKFDLSEARKEHNAIIKNLKCSLFFEIDKTLYELKIDNNIKFTSVENVDNSSKNLDIKRNIKIISILSPNSTELLNTFFYSIVLNYSHHSLNSLHLGFWINTLFHKNDGYKTPAVINPMRENGKFDINHENYLAKQRLLVNLLIDCLVNDNRNPFISDKQRLFKVRFKKNEQKEVGNDIKIGNKDSNNPKDDFIISGKNANLLNKIYDLIFEEGDLSVYDNSLPFNELVHNYVSDKAIKIEEQYPEYKIKWEKDDNIFTVTDRYAKFLIDDNSHITFKLKQALYFLQKTAKDDTSTWKEDQRFFEFSLFELLNWMEIKEIEDLQEIFKRIPPSIFNIEFLICENLDDPKTSIFEELSSGEQQKIHTINSIVYHLNNLYSVHLAKSEKTRIKYNYLNIILDEIELYFHPDLQRKFIYELIETLKTNKHLESANFIKGLNFIFSTHSPFILSDIPKQNTLKLAYNFSEFGSKGKKYSIPELFKRQTFGANIHNLLADSFFMGEGFIGEFAKRKIQLVLDNLNKLGGIEIRMEQDEIWNTIQLIGEPFLKNKLSQMYFEKYPKDENLDAEISAAKAKLAILESIKNQDVHDSN